MRKTSAAFFLDLQEQTNVCMHAHFFIFRHETELKILPMSAALTLDSVSFPLLFHICMHMHALPFPKRKKWERYGSWAFLKKKTSGQFAAPVTSPVAVLPFHFLNALFLSPFFGISKKRNPSIC